jgi:glycosyltransferase involved in cell wall biosynthesis
MMKRVFVLYSEMAPYMASCLRELQASGCEIRGLLYPKDPNAPLDLNALEAIGQWESRTGLSDEAILERITAFAPEVVLAAGWMDKGYCRVLARLAGRCLRVGLTDSQYHGTLRQKVACLGSQRLQRRWFDVLWATGERQADYARRLGFSGTRLWQGAYACEWERFAAARLPAHRRERKFLFVGRFVEAKGIDVLKEAYRTYRTQAPDPWALECIGLGPLKSVLEGEEGVEMPGFVQPQDLPKTMATAGAFVLPSREENWGVVLQEAAALGLPLIATEACGAGVHLLRDGWNGFTVETGSARDLTRAMIRMHQASDEARETMGEASYLLSQQYTPRLWAKTLKINAVPSGATRPDAERAGTMLKN